MRVCSPVILSLKMSGKSLKCPAKNLRFAGHFVQRITNSFREASSCSFPFQYKGFNFFLAKSLQVLCQVLTVLTYSQGQNTCDFACHWYCSWELTYKDSISLILELLLANPQMKIYQYHYIRRFCMQKLNGPPRLFLPECLHGGSNGSCQAWTENSTTTHYALQSCWCLNLHWIKC